MPQTIQGSISTDIATGTIITCFIFAISVYLPIVGFFCSLLIPLPVLFYRSKLGRKKGSIVPVASIILMIVITGEMSTNILFFTELLLLGYILSELIEINLPIDKTIFYACSSVLFAGFVGLVFYSNISNTGIIDFVSEHVAENLKLTMELYKNIGMPEESIYMFSKSMEDIQYVLVRILPSLIVASTLFVAWANLLLAKSILSIRSLFYPDFGALNQWKAPDSFVWIIIGCGVTLLFPDRGVKMLGLNGLIIMMTIYFFQGIAIISFYFEKKRFPRFLRIALYTFVAMQQVILLIVIGLGFFDMWLNFRKLGIKNSS
ncbi:MAG: YybS family protein [Deltaproteobacteria bacterium]|nr:YybS family protein [Deltaproteobacteria bacterium]MBW2662963.1 YybS family protein [Deltaproteobacteria bacterium]